MSLFAFGLGTVGGSGGSANSSVYESPPAAQWLWETETPTVVLEDTDVVCFVEPAMWSFGGQRPVPFPPYRDEEPSGITDVEADERMIEVAARDRYIIVEDPVWFVEVGAENRAALVPEREED